MRTLGKLYSNMADLMWFLTVIAFVFLLGIFPQVSVMPVPYYGGTVAQLLIMLMAPAIVVLVFFNLLSGRWPVADHRKRNVWTARLACAALILTALIVFLVNKGATGLPVLTLDKWTLDVDMLAKIGLFGTMVFAAVDAIYTKGDDYVATSYRAAGGSAEHPNGAGEASQQVFVRRIQTIMEPVYYARRRGELPPMLELRANPQPRPAPAPLVEPAAADAEVPPPQA